jgi:hypothetical protein
MSLDTFEEKTYSQDFIDKHRHFNVEHDWYDSVYDDFKMVCEILGIELTKDEPSFSGFWSQGDGASWTGHYRPITAEYKTHYDEKNNLKEIERIIHSHYFTAPAAIREYAPLDTKLHEIADALCFLNCHFTPVWAWVGRNGRHRYDHENTMQISEWEFDDSDRNDDVPQEIADEIESQLLEQFRELAGWLYKQLEKEYEYLTSDEAVIESLEANEIEEEKEETEECSD